MEAAEASTEAAEVSVEDSTRFYRSGGSVRGSNGSIHGGFHELVLQKMQITRRYRDGHPRRQKIGQRGRRYC